jgi:hypothetical protein
MPAPAAPAPAVPSEIRIPAMKDLTGATPPPAPAPGAPTIEAPPVVPVEPAAPAAPVVRELETDIIQRVPPAAPGAAPINTQKGAEQFKQERLQKKQEKQDAAELQAQLDQHKIMMVEKETALEKLQRDLDEERKQREIDKKLAEDMKRERDTLQASYFDTNRLSVNPTEDTEFTGAQNTMLDTLRLRLPIRVAGGVNGNGEATERRVFFDAILQQKGAAGGLANMLDAYAIAERAGDDGGIQKAVSAMARWLGAENVEMGPDEAQWKLLPTSDPTFKAIEAALKEATPHHLKRIERYSAIEKEGPRLAQQQFMQREEQIRHTLAADIFMSPQAAAERLRVDNSDSQALLAILTNQVPALKQLAERKLAEIAPAFASLGDRLYIPGLSMNDPAQIAAHRQREAQTRAVLSRAMRMAVVAEVMGPALAATIAQRDAAEERAAAASLVTNPLPPGSRPGDHGTPPATNIETDIVTGR